MNFTVLLKNIAKRVYRTQTVFAIDVAKQKQFLNTFPEPRDLYERSYFQYKCQMSKLTKVLVVLQHILAFVLFPFYFIKLSILRSDILQSTVEKCAIFVTDGISVQTIPQSLRLEFDEIIPVKFASEMVIGSYERNLLCGLISRYWCSPYFIFKCMLKISMYAAIIEKFSPRAIISYSEYSFTSSILTEYCRLRKVEHINVMHGEKLYNIRDAFVQYDRYYVWAEHYVNLLTSLRADEEQFRIAIPNSVKLDVNITPESTYEFTYYLGAEETQELKNIKAVLLKTGVPSSRICIRYHPRYCDANEIAQIFAGFQIENPTEVPLAQSLSKTKYVVSLFSTVLYQADENNKKIIIDDVTDKMKYQKLKELQYIMLEKPHCRLSEYLSDRGKEECAV